MLVVPTQPLPAQTFTTQLGGQNCRIDVYQKTTGLFLDLYVNDALVVGGVIALNGVRMVVSEYLGFIGDLAFYDTQGSDDPVYSGLGDRWFLAYLEASDIA